MTARRARDVRGPICGLLAAVLFGASVPMAKLLVGTAGPVALAGVFYLGAGLFLWIAGARRRRNEPSLGRSDVPLLAAITLLGGVIGPVAMLYGLSRVSGVAGALLLNLEAPFTMLVALAFFGEHLARRALLAAGLVVAGGIVLARGTGELGGSPAGILALAGACLAWAIDNNLTQRLSLRDPLSIVRVKALGAGTGNLALALIVGEPFPSGGGLVLAVAIGVLGYGVSIVLDTYALRFVGAAREAAYFATAPFFGAVLAVPLLGERLDASELGGGAAMAVGIALLLRERHGHHHEHASLTHEHAHVHDDHHRHAHDAGETVVEGHSHRHVHEPLGHAHPHVSDAHHRHRH